jgi:lipopolysaccharide transport system permease protein
LFPRINLPLIAAGSALVNNVLLFLATITAFVLLGHTPGIQILWMPILILLTLALGLGVGLLLGVFNVFIRDVGQTVPVILQLGFWFTPIVYSPSIVPVDFRFVLYMNPLTTIVQGFQNVMLFNRAPDFSRLGWLALVTASLLATVLALFRRASGDMVDAL